MADNTPAPSAISVEPKKEFTAEDVFEPHILAKTDPEVVKIVLGGINRGVPPTHAVPIEERRAHPDKYKVPWARDSTGWPRVSGQELTSEDGAKFPIKIYHPDPDVFGEGPYGVHLNFHGGGFVFGDLENESTICDTMRNGAGIVVIDVNYRHCPEVTWGKAIEDAWAALKWARESAKSLNINPDSVSVGGISAGGHISLVLQHIARDANVPLKLCLATVPGATKALFYKYYIDSPHPSFHEFFRGPILPWKSLEYFGEYCFPRDKIEERLALIPDWWADPLFKAKNWSGLCETYIRTAETDPLRDEGEAYAFKLVTAGNKVTMKRYLGCPHVFMFWKGLKQKQEWDRDSVRALKEAHGTV
ncbi:putative Alpha/Beta hydrolase protein [Seiridium cardinale]|uniref:Alpha/Beta hydrolase protein n=1 Tax=Seiridium cardinale TaxID=138064 RepID=A0ABR2XCI3_9PEZI